MKLELEVTTEEAGKLILQWLKEAFPLKTNSIIGITIKTTDDKIDFAGSAKIE